MAALTVARRVLVRRAMRDDETEDSLRLTEDEVAALGSYTSWAGLESVFHVSERLTEARSHGSALLDRTEAHLLEQPEEAPFVSAARQLSDNVHSGQFHRDDVAEMMEPGVTDRNVAVPPRVARTLWSAIERMGFRSGRIIDPSAGNGVFVGTMPGNLGKDSIFHAVESNPLDSQVLEAFYPGTVVTNEGFESFVSGKGRYDVAIGRIPLILDRRSDPEYDAYHLNGTSHYLLKAMDRVHVGGVAAFMVPTSILNDRSNALRRALLERGDLLRAIRVPSSAAIGDPSGKEMDVLVFSRQDNRLAIRGVPNKDLPVWARPAIDLNPPPAYLDPDDDDDAEVLAEWPSEFRSPFFLDNPDLVLSDELSSDDVARHLGEILADVPENVFESAEASAPAPSFESPRRFDQRVDVYREGAMILDDDHRPLMIESVNEDDVEAVPVDDLKSATGKSRLIPKNGMARLVAMLRIRDQVVRVLNEQIANPKEDSESYLEARDELNQLYDAFVEKHGALNDKHNAKLIRFDPQSNLLLSIEDHDPEEGVTKKQDIFFHRVVSIPEMPSFANDAEEALEICLAHHARVIPSVIMGLLDRSESDFEAMVESDLADKVFFDPDTTEWLPSDVYLSGNVRQKWHVAKREAQTDSRFDRNAEALEKVIPEDIPVEDISVQVSAPWLEIQTIREYMAVVMGIDRDDNRLNIGYSSSTNTWSVNTSITGVNRSPEHEAFSTDRRDFADLMSAGLNRRPIRIFKPGSSKKKVVDAKATMAAIEKLDEIERDFRSWIWSDPERTEYYHQKYNERYNSFVRPRPDGSRLVFPGMNPLIELRPHQKDSVRFSTINRQALLAHEVGTGKTFSMIASLMENRRTGAVDRPWMVVKRATLSQISSAARQLYPSATILTINPEDLSPENRNRVLSQMISRDYDLAIMSQETFSSIGVQPMVEIQRLEEQIAWLEHGYDEAIRAKDRIGIKEIGRRLRSLKERQDNQAERHEKLIALDKDGEILSVEDLKPDMIAYDESQALKNGDVDSRNRELANDGSIRTSIALSMFRELEAGNPDFRMLFSSGTPVTNSFSEVFMLFRFLAVDTLMDMTGTHHEMDIDPFAGQFIATETRVELGVEGVYKPRTRFRIESIPELMQAMHFMDVRFADDLGIPRPKLQSTTISAEPTLSQKIMRFEIADRAEAIQSRRVTPKEDNYLKLALDGRKAATDPRLIDPRLPDDPNSKINLMIKEVLKRYRRFDDVKGTQAIFLDQGVPKQKKEKQSGINLYEDIRKKLDVLGIPRSEIAFIHEAKTDRQREKLFDAINAGRIRVIIGSTEKMGVGTNMQERMVAGHHVDPPATMRPADMEQRIGRFYRQGNRFGAVENLVYTTQGSFDLYVFQLMEAKRRVIHAVLRGDRSIRQIQEDDGMDSFEDIMAATTNDPAIADKISVDAEVARLLARKDDHERSQSRLKTERWLNESVMKTNREEMDRLEFLGEKFHCIAERWDEMSDEERERPWRAWVDLKTGALVHDPDSHPNECDVVRMNEEEVREAMKVNRKAMLEMAATMKLADRHKVGDSFGLRFHNIEVELVMRYSEGLGKQKEMVRQTFRTDYQRSPDQAEEKVMVRSKTPKGYEQEWYDLPSQLAYFRDKMAERQKTIDAIDDRIGKPFPYEKELKAARLRQQKAATQAEKAIDRLKKEREGIPYNTVKEYLEALKAGQECPETWSPETAVYTYSGFNHAAPEDVESDRLMAQNAIAAGSPAP